METREHRLPTRVDIVDNTETFYWARATYFMLVIKVAEYFCGGLTEAEKRQLFDEHVQWYRCAE